MTVFACSYLYRVVISVLRAVDHDWFLDIVYHHEIAYAYIGFFMYIIGEQLPLFILFLFHYFNLKQQKKN